MDISPHHRPIFCWGKNRNRATVILKIFPGTETRISAGVGKIDDQVTVISMTHLPRFTPLFMALSGGGQLSLLFVV